MSAQLAQLERLNEDLVIIEKEFARREHAAESVLLAKSLGYFVEKAWDIVEPMMPFYRNWHIDELCEVLESVTRGETKRVLINVPPGTMKSLLVSVFFPAWEWASNPSLKYLTASYSAHLSIRDNVRLRQIVTSDWYQGHFPHVRLTGDQSAKEKFSTTRQGLRFATSVNGAGTGEHIDRIIIDDPLTAQQARSSIERDSANLWFSNTISSRGIGRGVAIIVIMQRLHQEDMSGYLLARGGFEHVKFPMRYEPTREASDRQPAHVADARDHRTVAGELLMPALLPEPVVRQLEIDLGPYGTAGQLQQRPAPEGGGLFKREWFKFVEAAPAKAQRCRGWDTAGTEGGGDYTVGAKLAMADGQFYVEHVHRKQLGPAGVDALIQQTAAADGRQCWQREEKERGASGVAVVTSRAKMLNGVDYAAVAISGDKVTRARPFRAQCEAGNVSLVRTGDYVIDAWIEPYIAELCDFPAGAHDDQVDGSSCAFNSLVSEKKKSGQLVW
jgi:predicted phage terminase large subunit-like protein